MIKGEKKMFLIINVVIVASSTVSILSRNAFISSSFYRADMLKHVKFLYDFTSRSSVKVLIIYPLGKRAWPLDHLYNLGSS